MTILVTGASGNVGRNVVDLLIEAGAPVRAASRNPQAAGLPADVDVRAVDLADPETFADALTDVDKVFLFAEPSAIDGVVDAAKAAGVRHVVLLSSMATAMAGEKNNPITRRHAVIEEALENSGLAWTFLRPGSFATNTLRMAGFIKEGLVRVPYAEARIASIHERDIAEVGVRALLDDGHEGAAYVLTGPEAITQRRQIELIAETIGRPVQIVDLDPEQSRELLTAQFGSFGTPEIVASLLRMFASQVDNPPEITDTVAKIIGRPARTFAEWAVDHKADFTD
jgi:uncharacterized protein YbjT (DUF2867 family)